MKSLLTSMGLGLVIAQLFSLPFHLGFILAFSLWWLAALLLRVFGPEISQRKLEEAEWALLRSIRAGVEERWVKVSTGKADFLIHSIHVPYTGGTASRSPSLAASGSLGAEETLRRPFTAVEEEKLQETSRAQEDPAAAAGATAPASTLAGADNLPRPRDIVVIHGHSAGVGHWESVCDELSKLGNLHLIDLPGWGRSIWPKEVQGVTDPVEIIDLHMEVLIGWMKAHGLEKVVVLAHSFGGMLGIHLATRCPDQVQHLMVVSPAGLFPVMPDATYHFGIYFRFLTPQRIARFMGRLGYILFKTMFLKYSKEDRRFPDYYYQLAAATARNGTADVLFAQFVRFRGTVAWWSHPITSLLMNLACPLTVIWGEHDPILPARFGPILHRIRPQTDVHIIRNSKHNPAHSRAQSFVQSIMASIEKHVPVNGCIRDPVEPRLRSKLPLFQRRSSGVFRLNHPGVREEVTLGQGVGFCHSCFHEVHVYKSYWRCSCGAWSFNAFYNLRKTREHVDRMLGFLEELYVEGTFDAKNSRYVTQFLSVKTPLFTGEVEKIELEQHLSREKIYTAGELLEFD